jgi:hypothetical protein
MNSQENLVYCGSYSTTQTDGNKKLLNYGAPTYSDYQNELYGRALVGLKVYKKEQLYSMNSTKKKRIRKLHKRAQDMLNIWKQELMIAKTNAYAGLSDRALEIANAQKNNAKGNVHKGSLGRNLKFNPNEDVPFLVGVSLLKKLFDTPVEPDPSFTCRLSFKDLGLNKELIIEKFLESKILPSNFYSL